MQLGTGVQMIDLHSSVNKHIHVQFSIWLSQPVHLNANSSFCLRNNSWDTKNYLHFGQLPEVQKIYSVLWQLILKMVIKVESAMLIVDLFWTRMFLCQRPIFTRTGEEEYFSEYSKDP